MKSIKRFILFVQLLAAVTLVFSTFSPALGDSQTRSGIRLVLQITIDGLRADLIKRYEKGFGKGGFKYLLDKGVVYKNAHYQYANTETIVGHATLSTGTFPSQHGMVGNVWFDRKAGELAYNIEDPDHPIIPTRKNASAGEQVDPAQYKSRTKGRSPAALLVPTIGDVMSAYTGGRSKIFSVSGKDRSAVSVGGHTGKAFWYSTDTGDFVTSTYYYDAYPKWVQEWNASRKAKAFSGESWTLKNDASSYALAAQDDRPYEADLKGYGRVFPHPFGDANDKLFYTRLLVSPVVDQITLDFVEKLILNEELGQDAVPDYLSISFSGVDAVNHFFGPSSLENEDVVVQLDHTLSDLLAFIDKTVGLNHTLVILAADHGMADMPEYMTELGYRVGRINPDDIVAIANRVGKKAGVDEVVRFFYRPYLYLDHEKMVSAKVDPVRTAQAVADELTDLEGVALAVTAEALESNHSDPLVEQVRKNQHITRSGDIYVIQKPYWFLFEKGFIASMHGSPWRYDTHVPVIFMGPGIDPKTVYRPVHPVDVAPTITAVLGMTPPGGTQGTPLEEVFK